MEYNLDDEEWQDIGIMKVARNAHEISIVGFDDFANWCIWIKTLDANTDFMDVFDVFRTWQQWEQQYTI